MRGRSRRAAGDPEDGGIGEVTALVAAAAAAAVAGGGAAAGVAGAAGGEAAAGAPFTHCLLRVNPWGTRRAWGAQRDARRWLPYV